jgi:Protein of unknown function (DUF3305)
MSAVAPQKTIAVGVVVERSKGTGLWTDFLWRPLNALSGVPAVPAWTKLSDNGERATFYAGAADVELYRSEAGNYRENLLVETPLLWIALRPAEADPPFSLAGVTADPAEGESWAGLDNDLVDTVPMPAAVKEMVAAFVSEHYVEQTFRKRQRDRADPEALARRDHLSDDGKP